MFKWALLPNCVFLYKKLTAGTECNNSYIYIKYVFYIRTNKKQRLDIYLFMVKMFGEHFGEEFDWHFN